MYFPRQVLSQQSSSDDLQECTQDEEAERGWDQVERNVVDWAVRALAGAAHFADVQHVHRDCIEYGFVEPLWSVVVVHSDGQVARHVRHWIPSF